MGGYYWVTDQAGYVTNVFCRNHASLDALFPSVIELSMTAFGAEAGTGTAVGEARAVKVSMPEGMIVVDKKRRHFFRA